MSRIDDIFDVGRQHEAHEGGMWVRSDTCVTCNVPIPDGSSWCRRHHPSNKPIGIDPDLLGDLRRAIDYIAQLDNRDRCVRCGRPLVDGIERATGVCHNCRVMGDSYGHT